MKEIVFYIGIIFASLVVIAVSNKVLNDSKEKRCIAQGGLYFENTTEASLSFCQKRKW